MLSSILRAQLVQQRIARPTISLSQVPTALQTTGIIRWYQTTVTPNSLKYASTLIVPVTAASFAPTRRCWIHLYDGCTSRRMNSPSLIRLLSTATAEKHPPNSSHPKIDSNAGQSTTNQSHSKSSSSSKHSSSSSSYEIFRPQSWYGRILPTVGFMSILYFLVDTVGHISGVRGSSMQPTLNPHAQPGHPHEFGNDVVWVSRIPHWTRKYQRGEVVVLTSPTNPKVHTTKRIIGIGGDWVRDQLDPEVIRVIPSGRIWIEGDNALTSVDDSRKLGPIPAGLLEGRVTYILWPPSRFGAIKTSLEPAGGVGRLASTEEERQERIKRIAANLQEEPF